MKAIVVGSSNWFNGDGYVGNPVVNFYNPSTDANVEIWSGGSVWLLDSHTPENFASAVETLILGRSSDQGYGLTLADISWNEGRPSSPRAFANPSRTLNSAFQISTARDAQVSYSVDISTALTLSGGQSGTVFVEYADDSGFTTNVVEIGRFVNGNTGTLALGLAITQVNTATVAGIVPAGKYVRLRTANTTGTPTFTFRSSQEVLI